MVLSQVPPGFTRKIQWPLPQRFYQVETLIFGQAVTRALNPERFIIGTEDPQTPLPPLLLFFLNSFKCPILPMRYESAELSKIAINMFLVSSISTTNILAELCEKIGADWAEIIPSLQLDKRIGKYAYLFPGLGIGGGNLERDLATFCSLASQYGTESTIVRAWQSNARYRKDWVLKKLHAHFPLHKNGLICGILGLSYKKDTASIKNSPALALISHLTKFSLRLFDPIVKCLPDCYSDTQSFSSAQEAYRGADALLIMTPWDEFKALSPQNIAENMRGKTVIDPYGILDGATCRSVGLNHYKLGISS